MARMGHPAFPILARQRAPIWPAGVTGSISHAEGFCAVAAAPTITFASLGVDVELQGRLDQALWPLICTPVELERLARTPPEQRSALATVIFSAKEAFYKCQHPLTQAWVGFEDVTVEVHEGQFRIRDAADLGIEGLSRAPLLGRFELWRGYVVSAIILPAENP